MRVSRYARDEAEPGSARLRSLRRAGSKTRSKSRPKADFER
jgi:hypothetical protein